MQILYTQDYDEQILAIYWMTLVHITKIIFSSVYSPSRLFPSFQAKTFKYRKFPKY